MDWVDLAKKVAQNSIMKFKHGAVLVSKKGKLLSTGFNYNYGKNSSGEYIKIHGNYSMHAERDAIFRAFWEKKDLKESTLYIVRISGDNLKNSKPCIECAEKILKFGIKNIYYSVDESSMFRVEYINMNNLDEICQETKLKLRNQ